MCDLVTARDDLFDGLGAQEAVPADAVAADDGLEEEGRRQPRVDADEPTVGEHGRDLVRHQPAVQGHEIAGGGQPLEGGEVGGVVRHGEEAEKN